MKHFFLGDDGAMHECQPNEGGYVRTFDAEAEIREAFKHGLWTAGALSRPMTEQLAERLANEFYPKKETK